MAQTSKLLGEPGFRLICCFNRTVTAFLMMMAILLAVSLAQAQWSNDPRGHIRYGCGVYDNVSGTSSLCPDGVGGVFYATAFTTGGWADERRFWLVHVNADGYMTMEGDECPDMIRVDSAQYATGHDVTEVRLIPCEPPGTVIVLSNRYLWDDFENPTYLGMLVAKFDTLGLTGFGRVFIPADSTHLFGLRGYEGLWDFEGPYQGFSDHHGGVHIVLWSNGGRYYNHVSATGVLRYPLPGALMQDIDWNLYLYPDGVGGVFDIWGDTSNPSVVHAIRFDALGDSVYESGGRTLTTNGVATLIIPLTFNRVLLRSDVAVGGGLYEHYAYVVDTDFVNLFETNGRFLIGGVPNNNAILPDRTSGFFYYEHITDSTWSCRRYDAEAQLIASSEPSGHVPSRADGLGGGYSYRMFGGYQDTVWSGGVWRWGPDMIPAWDDSLEVWRCNDCGSSQYTAVNGGGFVGVIGASSGFAFYHVNPDGTLGPRTDANTPPNPLPKTFEIVSVYPNPFNGPVHLQFVSTGNRNLKILVYDVLGREVYASDSRWAKTGTNDFVWQPQGMASGSYYVRLRPVNGSAESPTVPIIYLK